MCNIILQFMKDEVLLSKIWLDNSQSLIYLDLLRNWESSMIDISQRTKLNRPLLYKTIPYLEELWLVSRHIKWKRVKFMAESPEKLKNLFEKLSNKFFDTLPWLQEIFDSKDSKPTFQVLEGKLSIKYVFEDIVTTLWKWETYYRYSSRANFTDLYKLEKYKKLRDEKQIQRMVITSEKKAKWRNKKLDREVVYIPEGYDLFDQNVAKMIYKDKIAIIDYNTFSSVIIENKILARFEEKIFLTLYKFLRDLWNWVY